MIYSKKLLLSKPWKKSIYNSVENYHNNKGSF